MPRIVIAAGGTAGHVVPALAIADELRAKGAEVFFVGTRERVEAQLVPAAGYEISYLSVAGLDRSNPIRAARAALKAVAAVPKALRLLRRLRPDAVLGAGGYVAGPVGLAAAMRGIPLVLLESDSRLGMANRLLAPLARRVCLAFEIAGRGGPRHLVTGRPVPKRILSVDRDAARVRLGVPSGARCLFVFGGSLGARSINLCALDAFADRAPQGGTDSVVLHIAGRRDYPELSARLEAGRRGGHYRLFEYVEDFADPLAAADLVLARAGGSLFELAAAGKPAVLVPYPYASAGHQATNARWMADAGAAVVIDDANLDPAVLRSTVAELLGNPERLSAMAEASRALARPDAAARVADELLKAAGAGGTHGGEEPWRERQLHFVGIGGAGMSGLALIARRLGAEVSGCDRAESGYVQMLRKHGVEALVGHSPDHVRPGMELVVSTAIADDAPELVAAREQGAGIHHRGELLAEVASLRRLVAVAGTHGKTTTAAMIAHCLTALELGPGFAVGAELRGATGEVAANASWSDGEWFVAEADESDRSFLELSPEIAVVTNVELDHHTTYGSLIELEQAFASFLARLPEEGAAVVWDRAPLRRLASGRRLLTYDIDDGHSGAPEGSRIVARTVRQEGLGTRFLLERAGQPICEVDLPVPGRHNVLNALAALSVCGAVGCDLERAAQALASFRPAARRFELKGDVAQVCVIDDYAHHSTEVGATIETARALGPRRLVVVFQPHLYSRTLRLHRELGRELARADLAVVLDVYPARERPEGQLAGVSGKLVADACADHAGGRPVWWLPTLEEAEEVLSRLVSSGDVVLTLGAGDVDRLADRLVARLRGRSPGEPGSGAPASRSPRARTPLEATVSPDVAGKR